MESFQTPEGAPFRYRVDFAGRPPRRWTVEGSDVARCYVLHGGEHADFLKLYTDLAADFGMRPPLARSEIMGPDAPALRPLLTKPLSPELAYGYGDPCVLWADGPEPGWRLVVTTNDLPDAFPILKSRDLQDWTPAGFVFPEGGTPVWALTGLNRADFWAPEMHRVVGEYWVCFVAREQDSSLAIGLAKSPSPDGPFTAGETPLVRGGVIDPHILIDRDGTPLLLWKTDSNDLWPRLLADLLHRVPQLIAALFPDPRDQRTAGLIIALWPWIRTLEPMGQFFVQQPLIEAVTADFDGVRARLRAAGRGEVEPILDAFRTRIFAQPIAPDGQALTGEPKLILENDQPWEAHLIEGVWAVEHEGRYYLLYAGNDFSTPHYAIGAAVADNPLGPYRKLPRPLLTSSRSWWGPGHPSVAKGPDGRWRIFLHAFLPGQAGYKAFRALLTSEIHFEGDEIRLVRQG